MTLLVGARNLKRPKFDEIEVREIVRSLYDLSGSFRELPSERDQNFLLVTETGEKYVLKISASSDRHETIDFQNKAMHHIASKTESSLSPRILKTVAGEEITRVESQVGKTHFVRMISYLHGRVMSAVNPHTPEMLLDFGKFVGSISASLADFDHPATHREFYWDLRKALSTIGRFKEHISNKEKQELVEYFSNLYKTMISPRLKDLRKSVIHNDVNNDNIIINNPHDETRSFGILDFGDMVYSHTINELAITIAYVMLDKPDPLAAAQKVIAGYNSVFPITEMEVELLFPLACIRLATSVCVSAYQQKLEPDNEYLTISEDKAWSVLSYLAKVNPRFATYCFREAIGLEPCPDSLYVATWLKNNSESFSSPIGISLDSSNSTVFDLSVGSTDVESPLQLADPQSFGNLVTKKLKAAGVEIGIGRYNESRLIYLGEQYQEPGNEHRTVHLAIDLFVKSGTPVLSVYDGVIHSFQDNSNPLDNGPTIVIEHKTSPGGPPFYILYSHLTRDSLDGLSTGRVVKQGEEIGRVGTYPENGGWPPHLHFQLIVDMMDKEEDLFGVAPPSKRNVWLSVCPDPNLILKIPETLFPELKLSQDEILALRAEHIGQPLSVSYKEPLTIARGFMQYLYDVDGREYLDIRNNVPHVGHSNPRIVKVLSQQASVLNTNTRYLHENLVKYAKRLTSKLPEKLSVCFFVNSGSEANELALRLARTHTRRRDIIAIDGAYHGNTSELINISSYKHNGPGGEGAPPYVHIVRMPDTYRGEYKRSDAGKRYAEDILNITRSREIAAFIFESLMGCGGQIIFPNGYLREAFKHVHDVGGVCIADEVQVGFGRMGDYFWGFETQGVVPDIVTMGKPIGNGHPIGAVVTTHVIAESFTTGMEFFSTTGGNTVSCTVGMAVLDEIENRALQNNAKMVGTHLLNRLRGLMNTHHIIGDVRGHGLFIGVELVRNRGTLEPAKQETKYVVERLRDLGLLVSLDGPFQNVLKIKPPLVFTKENADRFVDTLDKVLKEDPVIKPE